MIAVTDQRQSSKVGGNNEGTMVQMVELDVDSRPR